jgi:hypothetical protein
MPDPAGTVGPTAVLVPVADISTSPPGRRWPLVVVSAVTAGLLTATVFVVAGSHRDGPAGIRSALAGTTTTTATVPGGVATPTMAPTAPAPAALTATAGSGSAPRPAGRPGGAGRATTTTVVAGPVTAPEEDLAPAPAVPATDGPSDGWVTSTTAAPTATTRAAPTTTTTGRPTTSTTAAVTSTSSSTSSTTTTTVPSGPRPTCSVDTEPYYLSDPPNVRWYEHVTVRTDQPNRAIDVEFVKGDRWGVTSDSTDHVTTDADGNAGFTVTRSDSESGIIQVFIAPWGKVCDGAF